MHFPEHSLEADSTVRARSALAVRRSDGEDHLKCKPASALFKASPAASWSASRCCLPSASSRRALANGAAGTVARTAPGGAVTSTVSRYQDIVGGGLRCTAC